MSLLTIVQDGVREIGGFAVPSTVVGGDDPLAVQSLAIINGIGRELAVLHDWQSLITGATITTVNGQANYAIPADLRKFANVTFWDRTEEERIIGPVSPEEWQTFQSGLIESTTQRYFRVGAGLISFFPTPDANGDTFAYEYFSRNWVLSAASVAKAAFDADDDTSRIDEELIRRAFVYRLREAKGLDAEAARAHYLTHLAGVVAIDKPRPIISTLPGRRFYPDVGQVIPLP